MAEKTHHFGQTWSFSHGGARKFPESYECKRSNISRDSSQILHKIVNCSYKLILVTQISSHCSFLSSERLTSYIYSTTNYHFTQSQSNTPTWESSCCPRIWVKVTKEAETWSMFVHRCILKCLYRACDAVDPSASVHSRFPRHCHREKLHHFTKR